jgi:superfamily II DNA or RNA helicase
MEPLRKALRLPRVNLFIADDSGLGKTIEAGLIARELLLRKRARMIVVAAPPSVLEQWKAELDERFGLLFEMLDRQYLARVRRERGFGVNPWRTHSRFLISHNLLIDPVYADPMREWLGPLLPGSLLILDEAHHAAPSSGGRYGIETKFTRAIRDLGGRFEHRLFLSATPHNGHSNSFSTLLELLDPYRFTRGVPVRGRKALEEVMVRRIKEDIREVQGGFPRRKVERLVVGELPPDAPELVLSRLLDEYRGVREQRFSGTSTRTQASAALLVVGLQQRLLSSIEAFAQSLKVHQRTLERQRRSAAMTAEAAAERDAQLLLASPGPDDERGSSSGEELDADEAALIEAVAEATESVTRGGGADRAVSLLEQELLAEMETIAEHARHLPDYKTLHLIDWIRENLCPGLPLFGQRATGAPATWENRRVLIFTESREGTKRYLRSILEQAIAETERADERIEVITGLTSGALRKEIQRRFNTDPAKDPLRILIATDAAREGLNFQAHCSDLFHFDLPWNPGRIEQRNGRIDRKLQPAAEVRCHYFVLPQRAEDRVLDVLVRKTETIRRELGSLSKVIDDEIERRMSRGIRHRDAEMLAAEIERADLDAGRKRVTDEEFEQARERQQELRDQIDRCRVLLERSRTWVGFQTEPFRNALSCSLELLGADPLEQTTDELGRPVWRFPSLDRRAASERNPQ